MTQYSTFEEQLAQHGAFVYTNVGVSMLPLLRQGRDLMVITQKPTERCRKLDAVLFKRRNGQYILHRILEVREKDYYIVGDNCISGEYVQEDQILGVLTEVIRKGKRFPVTDPSYLRYVHLWCDHYRVRFAILRVLFKLRRIASRIKHLFS